MMGKTFDSLGISRLTLRALSDEGFTRMTEIQEKSIPSLLKGRDLIAAAKTGSGKTLAFLVPAVELLSKLKFEAANGTGVIVISPTRELCIQTSRILKSLLARRRLTECVIMGGTNKKVEDEKLKTGINFVVATPGRLLDHLKNTLEFVYANLQCLIIDEADRTLDMGFEREMKQILQFLPKKRQTMLFSATLKKNTKDLIELAMEADPIYVGLDQPEEKATVDGLEQSYVVCRLENRFLMLHSFLSKVHQNNQKSMVFFSTCRSVKFYHILLNCLDLPVKCIHGNQKQGKRTSTFLEFGNSPSSILLCTDVAARGLDIPHVDWIIQFDPANDTKEYIHRVGRTARGAGGRGRAILILRPEEVGFLQHLKTVNVQLDEHRFSWTETPDIQNRIKEAFAKDPPLRNSAKAACKSFVRCYSARHLKNVFDVNALDLTALARSFGLDEPLGMKKAKTRAWKKKLKSVNKNTC
uniref:ATP-dependent RNA helicase n=1 Tax=Strigamia maritima TaxID=126957 RepID=T1JCZ2_STRMM